MRSFSRTLTAALTVVLLACSPAPDGPAEQDDEDGKGDSFDQLAAAGLVEVRLTSADDGASITRVVVTASDGTFVREKLVAEGGVTTAEIEASRGDTVTVVRKRRRGLDYVSVTDVTPGDSLPIDARNRFVNGPGFGKVLGTVPFVLRGATDDDIIRIGCSSERNTFIEGGQPMVQGTIEVGSECLDANGSFTVVAKLNQGPNSKWMWKKGATLQGGVVVLDMAPVSEQQVSIDVDFPRELEGALGPLTLFAEVIPVVGSAELYAPATEIAQSGSSAVSMIPGLSDEQRLQAGFHVGDQGLWIQRAPDLGQRLDFYPWIGLLQKGTTAVSELPSGAVEIEQQATDAGIKIDGVVSTILVGDGIEWYVVSAHPSFVLPLFPLFDRDTAAKPVTVQSALVEGSQWRGYAGFRRQPALTPPSGFEVHTADWRSSTTTPAR